METDRLLSQSSVKKTDKEDVDSHLKTARKRRFLVEPIACLIFFATFLSAQVITNHMTYRACRAELGESEEVCRRLERKDDGLDSKDLETKVQPFVAHYLMVKVIIEALIPAVMSLFVGAWSDKHGRKKVILLAYSGFVAQFFLFYILGSISTPFKIEWYWITSIPIAITGGNCILLSSLTSYITDVYEPDKRGPRLGNFQIGLILGVFLGSAVSGLISTPLGTVNTFLVSAVVLLMGILYIIFNVPESIKVSKSAQAAGFSDLFKTDRIKDMTNSAFKPRQGHDRAIVWLIIGSFALTMFMQEGTNVVFFLFLREKFGWKLEDLSIFIIVATIFIIIGTKLGASLKAKYKLSDTATGILALLTLVLSNLVNSMATKSWHLYLSMFIGLFRGLPDTSARSVLATVLPSNEMGKINSVIGSIQAMCSLGSAPLYSWVYKNTLETNPATYLYMNAMFFFTNAVFFGIIHFLMKKPHRSGPSTAKKDKKS